MKISILLLISLFSHSLFSMDIESWNGQEYENDTEPQYQSALEIIEKDIGLLLKGSESILDVECQTGRTTRKLASMVPAGSIKGIDASAAMISYANQQKGNCANLSFEKANATRLYEEDTYDVVTSFLHLNWLKENKLPALQAISRSLKKEGTFIGSINIDNDNHPITSIFIAIAIKMGLISDEMLQNLYAQIQSKVNDTDHYASLFTQAKLNHEFNVKEEKYCFNSKEALTRWFTPLLKRNMDALSIESDNPTEFLHEMVDSYLTKINAQETGIYFKLSTLIFKATKV